MTDDLHDTDIVGLVQAATNHLRNRTGRELLTTTYELTASGFPCTESGGFELPFPPLISLTSIQYRNPSGNWQTYSGAQVEMSEIVPAIVWPALDEFWPAVQEGRIDAVKITYVAGYATPPPEAQLYVKLLVRHWYDNPSAVLVGSISKELEYSLTSLANALGVGFYCDS